jgi:hypothetical protein
VSNYARDCLVAGCEQVPPDGSAMCPTHRGPWPKYTLSTTKGGSSIYDPPNWAVYGKMEHVPAPSPALPDRPYYVLKGGIQVKDIVGDLPYNMGVAAAYILRAGKKPGNPAVDDIQKAIDHLRFELERLK